MTAIPGLFRPHVGYYDGNNDAVKHAWHEGGGWRVEAVARSGKRTSIGFHCKQQHVGRRSATTIGAAPPDVRLYPGAPMAH